MIGYFQIVYFLYPKLTTCCFLCRKQSKKSTEETELWNLLNESELDDSESDDDLEDAITSESTGKRFRVGEKILSFEDEQHIEDVNFCSDEEDFAGFLEDDVMAPNFEFEPIITEDSYEDLLSPIDYFVKYVPELLFEDMVQYTN